ncbi:sulfotransferase family protein [Catenuloplanes atrovinosus]|uniref:Sulfotransferase n=1 Tax=Catenuloplanes atrovinosus TaxID=137266 RepID=A0AAE4CC47_9ACTN|nr:sulfotransferase [Catenuloplanes atrovinosus]MDR7276195.1 hypothetical protein [Catenuloplanes atrovinosus]
MNLTLVVGSGRCGSTVLSRVLRDHPDILSVGDLPPVVRAGPPPPIARLYRGLLTRLAARSGRTTIVATAALHRLPALHTAFPEARLVHLYRDGPDCAVATRRRRAALPALGARWSTDIVDGVALLEMLPAARTSGLRYEDLVHSPEATLIHLAATLNLPVDGDWLSRSRTHLDTSTIGLAATLPDEDRAALEAACAPGMKALGLTA